MDSRERNKRRAFGQNFLVDSTLVEAIADDIQVAPGDGLIEIGPGKGALTGKLARKCRWIVALEIDPKWVDYHREKSPISNLQVYQADATRVKVEEVLANCPECQGDIWLAGNLPYNRSGPILGNFLPCLARFKEAHFMVQYEVAKRMTALPGSRNYGSLSVFIANYAQAEILRKISPEVFRPKPNVYSAMVKLVPHPEARVKDPLFPFFIKQCFSQKRKKLSNSLAPFIQKDRIKNCLQEVGLPETVRAEEINFEDFSRLFAYLKDRIQPGNTRGAA